MRHISSQIRYNDSLWVRFFNTWGFILHLLGGNRVYRLFCFKSMLDWSVVWHPSLVNEIFDCFLVFRSRWYGFSWGVDLATLIVLEHLSINDLASNTVFTVPLIVAIDGKRFEFAIWPNDTTWLLSPLICKAHFEARDDWVVLVHLLP
jgi:hypothetical protein